MFYGFIELQSINVQHVAGWKIELFSSSSSSESAEREMWSTPDAMVWAKEWMDDKKNEALINFWWDTPKGDELSSMKRNSCCMLREKNLFKNTFTKCSALLRKTDQSANEHGDHIFSEREKLKKEVEKKSFIKFQNGDSLIYSCQITANRASWEIIQHYQISSCVGHTKRVKKNLVFNIARDFVKEFARKLNIKAEKNLLFVASPKTWAHTLEPMCVCSSEAEFRLLFCVPLTTTHDFSTHERERRKKNRGRRSRAAKGNLKTTRRRRSRQ